MSANNGRTDYLPDPYLRAVLGGTEQPAAPSPPRLALTRQEAAAALGLSLDSFERHVQPSLRCNYIGSRRIYAITDLAAWLDRNAVASTTKGPT
jgi:hypothetical protein